MKQAGYNVGPTAFSTPEMENDAKNAHQYFRQIHAKNVKPGDIVIVNVGTGYGPNGHTAIIDGPYHGRKTQIIEIGGIDPMGAVHRSTIEQSFQSQFLQSSDSSEQVFKDLFGETILGKNLTPYQKTQLNNIMADFGKQMMENINKRHEEKAE